MAELPPRTGSALALFMRPALWQTLTQRHQIDQIYRRHARLVGITSRLIDPIRRYEHWRYDEVIAATPITQPPVFILGFWRTGTTYLHEVLACDPQFGYPTYIQALAPDAYLTAGRWLHRILSSVAPETRSIDNMPLDFENPQEDEVGLMNLTAHAVYHWWLFPHFTHEWVTRYALFEGITSAELDEWRQTYYQFLQKLTYAWHGRPLLLKNPPNTARIPQLLDLFPEAKFIHIYRDPMRVIPSFIQMFTISLHMSQLQVVTPEQIREIAFDTFERVMKRYLADRALIPSDRLIEIRYEEFVREPLQTLRGIYEQLDLGDYDGVETLFKQDIAGRANFQPSAHALSPDLTAEIRERCAFVIDAWGY